MEILKEFKRYAGEKGYSEIFPFYPSSCAGPFIPKNERGIGIFSFPDIKKICEDIKRKYEGTRFLHMDHNCYSFQNGRVLVSSGDSNPRLVLACHSREGLLDLLKEVPEIWEKILDGITFTEE